MEWFGASWGAPVCGTCPHVETPIGQRCARCGRPIGASDQGVRLPYAGPLADVTYQPLPYHLDCFLSGVLPGYTGYAGSKM